MFSLYVCAYIVYMFVVNDWYESGVVALVGFGDGAATVCRHEMAGGV